MIYPDKLVRDRIPELIRADGKECEVRILNEDEYRVQLNRKLEEELQRYLRSGDVTELTGMAEVLKALVSTSNMTADEFQELCRQKRERAGGFEKRLLLVSVSEP